MAAVAGAVEEVGSNTLIRAAQYVRMSTEHQKYSTENQADAIKKYADLRGMTIVKTYADEGKSGLSLDGRGSLQRLIQDVRDAKTDFSVVLVYDISRWGRFQDADESAYYEYVCKSAGIAIQYCAEQFENDGSLTATIIKNMKRAMAGEYSRELSAKVFAGQCRLITLGYRQGGAAGYGLRRQLVDEDRHPKALLAAGEQKSLQTDRIVLVPGPAEEVAVVQRMYRMFVERAIPESRIAEILNSEDLLTDLGRKWTRGTVHQVLTNEKYAGHNVFNRVSFKLKRKRVQNTADTWVRSDNAFEPIVDLELFKLAQGIIQQRNQRYSDEEMLTLLGSLTAKAGWISAIIIDEQSNMPSSGSYRHRFGSLLRAYSLVGYAPGRDYRYIETNRKLRAMYPDVVANVIEQIEMVGGWVHRDPTSDRLTINEEFSASLSIVRCFDTTGGNSRWKVRLDTGLRPDVSVVVRMAPGNVDVLDYYIFPSLDIADIQLRMSEFNGLALDAYRVPDLERFFELAARLPIRRVA